ncbi:hypothetical protein BofuT4_P009840.1 [Botrytis cinerea T4]|uniref:Uncharacterized protein n=1 Tax=Botryotinia fuckeliana (strain T4) TaxID=999810 RepID=G2XT22_BOTF4|nr:hypothetical protein BofuT4_P009840.1 [Botrytis cinerea T4]
MEMNGVRIMGGNKLWKKLVDKGSGIKKGVSAKGLQKGKESHIQHIAKKRHQGAVRYQHAHKLLQRKLFPKFLLFPISVTTTIYGMSNKLVLANETRETRDKRR